jgi:hypothetical protein
MKQTIFFLLHLLVFLLFLGKQKKDTVLGFHSLLMAIVFLVALARQGGGILVTYYLPMLQITRVGNTPESVMNTIKAHDCSSDTNFKKYEPFCK